MMSVFALPIVLAFVTQPKTPCEVLSTSPKIVWELVEGPCVKGKANGKGKATSPTWGEYVGDFKNGWFEGQGTWTHPTGETYTGEWRKGKNHGKGTCTFRNGEKYTGDWVNGLQEGQGTNVWPDGDKYVGGFKNGARHGKGTLYAPDGRVKYSGDHVDGEPTGQGWENTADGRKYVGEYRRGKPHGQGTLTRPDGSVIYSGIWRNGLPFNPGADFGLKTATDKDICNAVIHPRPNEKHPQEWGPYAGTLVRYFQSEFAKLQQQWAMTLGQGREAMHKALAEANACVDAAKDSVAAAEKLGLAACQEDANPGGCMQTVSLSYRSAEDGITETLVLPLSEAQQTTYQMVGRP